MFKQYGMTIVDFEEIPIHSGSIRVTVRNSEVDTPNKILHQRSKELATICNLQYLKQYTNDVKEHISDFNDVFHMLTTEHIGKKI